MLFGTQAPKSQYFDSPDIINDPKKQAIMKILGFNPNGTQTGWGKALGWIPGIGIGANAIANNIAKNEGASDTRNNTGEAMDNSISKLQTVAGVGMGVAGGLTGNPQLIGQGIGQLTSGIGGLAGDQNDYKMGGGTYYQ